MSEESPETKTPNSIYGKPFWLIVIATVTLLMVASIITNIMIQQENKRTGNTRPPETLLERRARQIKEEKAKKNLEDGNVQTDEAAAE